MAEETATVEEKFEVPAEFEKLVGEIDKLSVLKLVRARKSPREALRRIRLLPPPPLLPPPLAMLLKPPKRRLALL